MFHESCGRLATQEENYRNDRFRIPCSRPSRRIWKAFLNLCLLHAGGRGRIEANGVDVNKYRLMHALIDI